MLSISVRPTYSALFRRPITGERSYRTRSSLPLLNKANGSVSKKSAKRIRAAINWLLFFSKKKSVYSLKEKKSFTFVLSFITLTLADEQKHTDEYIKNRMLKPFLKWLIRQGCVCYVWKAEAQSNGRIHFHITVNQFVHWKSIRKKWNQIQSLHGYHKVFTKGTNEIGVNGTDVHSVKNEKEAAAYMAKYMTKDEIAEGKRAITGRLWGCSQNLSNISACLSECDGESFRSTVEWLGNVAENVFQDEYRTVLFHKHLKYLKLPQALENLFAPLIVERQSILDSQSRLINVASFF